MHGLTEPVDAPVLLWGKRPYGFHGNNLLSGNRCGHDPEQLATHRLALTEPKGGHRVKILDTLIKKAQAYFLDPEAVPLLTYLTKKKNKDGTYRQNRSECREALSLAMTTIFDALDLKSLRVGAYTPRGEFKSLNFDVLAKRCGLTKLISDRDNPNGPKIEVASTRFYRAIAWLKKAGAVEVFEQYETDAEGNMRGRPAIKTVSPKFMRKLGQFTQAALQRARVKSSGKVKDYVNAAVLATGLISKGEDQALDKELQQDAFQKQRANSKGARKNQRPSGVELDNSSHALLGDYSAYTEAVMAKIAADLGRPIRGAAESQRLWREYGGLSEPQWQRKRAGL